MEKVKKEKRKKYLINQIAQSKYAVIIVVYLIVYTILLSFFIYLPTIWILGSDKYPIYEQARASREFLFLEGRYLPALILVMILMGVHSIFTTHRFFGPIVRFKAAAREVYRGDLSARVFLRKNDFLKDYMEDFNLMIDSLDKKNKEINMFGTKGALLLTELLNEMEKGKLSANEVGSKISEALGKMKDLVALTESPAISSSED